MILQNEIGKMRRKVIKIQQSGISLVIEITNESDVRLLHFSSLPYNPVSIMEDFKPYCKLVQIQASGFDHKTHHGRKHIGCMPSDQFKYLLHKQFENENGTKLEIWQAGGGLKVCSHIQFYKNFPVISSWTDVENISSHDIRIESISSFFAAGIDIGGVDDWDKNSFLHLAHNLWNGECQWQESSMAHLGLHKLNGFSTKRIVVSGCGTWPTEGYLMTGAYENKQTGSVVCWDIEHNGSWMVEVSDVCNHLYLYISGPDFLEHHWSRVLSPNETFSSVSTAISFITGNVQDAFSAMTKYRRHIRRLNTDNINLPVVFNDYMNCLGGDPTTEKLLPLIDKAAEIGAEVFCIDAGWYGDGDWWDSVGQWLPSEKRFPKGIEEVIKTIKEKGMIAGLWLELESMGINCPLVKEFPDECFFIQNGKRVIYNGRYQLDWRHPKVIAHADSVIKRLVEQYGVGYIKMDYNNHFAPGTEYDADSVGDGLLKHNLAYLNWLDGVFSRYPKLTI